MMGNSNYKEKELHEIILDNLTNEEYDVLVVSLDMSYNFFHYLYNNTYTKHYL